MRFLVFLKSLSTLLALCHSCALPSLLLAGEPWSSELVRLWWFLIILGVGWFHWEALDSFAHETWCGRAVRQFNSSMHVYWEWVWFVLVFLSGGTSSLVLSCLKVEILYGRNTLTTPYGCITHVLQQSFVLFIFLCFDVTLSCLLGLSLLLSQVVLLQLHVVSGVCFSVLSPCRRLYVLCDEDDGNFMPQTIEVATGSTVEALSVTRVVDLDT